MKKLFLILLLTPLLSLAQTKIPITVDYIYQDNSQQSAKSAQLIDGDVATNVTPGGPFLYTTHDIVCDLMRWNATVTSVKMYAGSSMTTSVSVIVVDSATNTETTIGTFTGGNNQNFTYSNGSGSRVAKVILRCSSGYNYGSEVEIYGTYTTPPTPAQKVRRPLGWMTGAVAHSYDLMNDAKLNALKSLGIHNLRVWENGYDITDGSWNWAFRSGMVGDRYSTDSALIQLKAWNSDIYTWKVANEQYTPQKNTWDVIDDFPNRYIKGTVNSYSDYGSWGQVMLHVTEVGGADGYNYGRWYVYKNGALINKTETPEYLAADLPGQNRSFNMGGGLAISVGDTLIYYKSQLGGNPINYSDNPIARRNTDSAHLENGKAMFVYASRGGENASVPDYPVQAGERMLKGMGYYDAVEPMNEANHWWGNPDNFWNGKTIFYLQNMSYDGNKEEFANVGAKQADSTIDVLMGGLATDKPDQIYGMIEEARKVRGLKADGTIDVPFDAINVHIYPSAGGQYGGSNNGGLPWEIAGRDKVKAIVKILEREAPQCNLMITEWGWDQHPNSPLHAGVYGPYDRETVGAFWMVRGMLTMAADGVDRTTHYPLFQDWPESSSSNNSTQFSTMRLLRQPDDANADSIVRSRQGDYMAQYNEFANYTFSDSVETGQPWLHAYKYVNGDSAMIALWSEETVAVVSDTTQFTERTGTIDLTIPAGDYTVRQFKDDGSTVMSSTSGTSTGTVTFNYAAKPVFVQTSLAPPAAPQSNRFRFLRGVRIKIKQSF